MPINVTVTFGVDIGVTHANRNARRHRFLSWEAVGGGQPGEWSESPPRPAPAASPRRGQAPPGAAPSSSRRVAIARISILRIFPVTVIGNSSTTWT